MFKPRCPTVHTSLLLIGLMAMSLGSGMGRSAIADGIPGVTMGTETGAPPTTAEPNETVDNRNQAYTQAMLIGYAAAEQEDYHTALINFRRALNERPGDRYALAAIANMETYIARQRQEAARKRQLVALQDRVEVAVSARDWACAAATIDEMIMLVPANSLEKTRLVTYRGELSSLLDAREDAEQWSSICPG
jgi:tetratricopeptide (TPR) repeat protein